MVALEHIRNAVREMDLASLPVCVHCSLRSFGHVQGGPETVVRGFLEEGCTVLVPTFSDGFAVPPPPGNRPLRNGWEYEKFAGPTRGIGRIFTPDSNEIALEDMGCVPAFVLGCPGRVRGHHPLCSFAAVGPIAKELVRGQTPMDALAPLRALAEAGGRVVLMGVGLEKMTLLHAAEEAPGRKLFIRWANGPDGTPMAVRVGGCSDGFGRLEPAVRPFVRTCRVGPSEWQVYGARETLAAAAEVIRRDPLITHCGDQACERCRDAAAGGPIDHANPSGHAVSPRGRGRGGGDGR